MGTETSIFERGAFEESAGGLVLGFHIYLAGLKHMLAMSWLRGGLIVEMVVNRYRCVC